MKNSTLEQVVIQLNLAWNNLDDAYVAADINDYTALAWKIKGIRNQVEMIENEIGEKEYGNE